MARRQRRRFTRDFKVTALRRMAETNNIVALCAELGIERKLLYVWRDAFALKGVLGPWRACRPSKEEQAEPGGALSWAEPRPDDLAREIAILQRKAGEQAMALDFFREALPRVREKRHQNGVSGETDSTT